MFYKIGEFSKLVDIPVKTLRYYDECDVLKPSKIDSFTGYRYYSDDDIIDCEFVKNKLEENLKKEKERNFFDFLLEKYRRKK